MKLLRQGYQGFLAAVWDKKEVESKDKDINIVRKYLS